MTTLPTIEDFNALSEKLDQLTAMLSFYASNSFAPDVITVKEIAHVEHVPIGKMLLSI
mgnify:CR=1 FL=1